MTLCGKSTWTEQSHTSSRTRHLYKESFSYRPKWESGRRKVGHLIINEVAGNMFYSVHIHGINTSKKLSQRNSSSICQHLNGSKVNRRQSTFTLRKFSINFTLSHECHHMCWMPSHSQPIHLLQSFEPSLTCIGMEIILEVNDKTSKRVIIPRSTYIAHQAESNIVGWFASKKSSQSAHESDTFDHKLIRMIHMPIATHTYWLSILSYIPPILWKWRAPAQQGVQLLLCLLKDSKRTFPLFSPARHD